MLEEKNIQSKKYKLGQFFTPIKLVEEILSQLVVDSDIIVEPSFGGCGFIEPMVKRYQNSKIVGIELDEEWYQKGIERFPNLSLHHKNFYDVNDELKFNTKKVSFIGNVPFRSPAYSLTTHKNYVKKLSHKYGVTGIREEAVFFIIKTADIMITNDYDGSIHYIIPKSLITNDSKFYLQFKKFLKKYFKIVSVFDVDPSKFDNVAQGLIVLSMIRGGEDTNYNIKHNGIIEPVDSVLQLVNSDIPFQEIFKKTYLGSVPAESFLLSVAGETKKQFKDRLVKIFNNPISATSLKTDLKHNGKYHLKVLSSKDLAKVDSKLKQIADYANDVKAKVDIKIFNDIDNYHVIQQRKETRFYFRHTDIKKCNFVYELNPNPRPSFYFTSNPSGGSTDYFGYCDYDITRTSSPGCCRTIPLLDISENIHDTFKQYWIANTGNEIPIELIFSYIKYVSESLWYKQQKKIRGRFYFCIPKIFMKDWLLQLDIEKELKLILKLLENDKKEVTVTNLPKNKKKTQPTTFDDKARIVQQRKSLKLKKEEEAKAHKLKQEEQEKKLFGQVLA